MEHGQAAVEWLAVCLVAVALPAAALSVAAPRLRHAAIRGAAPAPAPPPDPLAAAYGAELAALVRRVTPGLVYERGMLALPVDPRRCRSHVCADASPRPGPVLASRTGEPVTLFTHVLARGEKVYVQLWAYYPDSTWSGPARALGAPCGCHADDWESVQVRVRGAAVEARASAHRGYTGRRVGRDLNVNQLRPRTAAWTRATGWLRVARGSHAGYLTGGPYGRRHTPAPAVRLVPLETAAGMPRDYAVTPPWRKRVWTDPEAVGTG